MEKRRMERIQINPINPQGRFIDRAVDFLRNGGLLIYPTDTVYGLGCDLFNKRSIEKIYQLKGRKKKGLLSFICADLKNIAKYAQVSTPVYKIMRHLLPGPYTFILPATRLVPKILLEKRKTVGIRVPDNIICQTLLHRFDNPIISTSARLAGQDYLNDPVDIEAVFQHTVDFFLDSGIGGVEQSTVIDLCESTPRLIRQGKGYENIGF
jgi:tRNA threonylcarbamoyl adenosine modification protein (Sua5/YciO/YrdC/YwlC family)